MLFKIIIFEIKNENKTSNRIKGKTLIIPTYLKKRLPYFNFTQSL